MELICRVLRTSQTVAASQKGKLHSASNSELPATQGEQSPSTPQDNVFVVFNFMHQLGRAMGAHMFGIWSNIILGESLRMLLDDLGTELTDKTDDPP